MWRALIFTVLVSFIWSISAFLIGYEMPYGALVLAVVVGWICAKSSINRKIPLAVILTIFGVVLAHYVQFAFYMQHPLDGVFSPLHISLFFQINHYVPNFWTMWDVLWLLLAIGLSILILRWQNR